MNRALFLIVFPFLFNSSFAQEHTTVYRPFIVPYTCCITHGVPKAIIDTSLAGKSVQFKKNDNDRIEYYDTLGRLIKLSYTLSKKGNYYTTQYSYDHNSNVIEIINFNNKGKIIPICSCGYHIVKLKYDSFNRLIEEATRDKENHLEYSDGSGTYCRVEYNYNDSEKRCIARYYDYTNSLVETVSYSGDTVSYYDQHH